MPQCTLGAGVHDPTRSVIVRFVFAVFLVAAASFVVMSESAIAQSMGGNPSGGGRKQHQEQKSDRTDAQKPKVDDKAYNAVLKSLPNKPFDSWHGVR